MIGHSNIQAILTGARQSIETAVQEQMQKTLDDYGAGVVCSRSSCETSIRRPR